MSNILKAELREATGKGAARVLRRAEKVPAIIYGGGKGETKIAACVKDLHNAYLRGSFTSRVFDIDLGKEKVHVLPRDIQLHPVTDVPLHADFQRVNNDSQVHVFVHVKFLNADKCPGIKRGGTLSIIRRDVELVCRADSIPPILEVDIGNLKIGESVHAHSLELPEGAAFAITDRDFTIAAIVGRRAQDDIEDDAPAAEEIIEGEEAEGEETSDESAAE